MWPAIPDMPEIVPSNCGVTETVAGRTYIARAKGGGFISFDYAQSLADDPLTFEIGVGMHNVWCLTDAALAGLQQRDTPARTWLQEALLPSPHVGVLPGSAITGRPAYLHVSNAAAVVSFDEPLGDDRLSGTARMTHVRVDWGDGHSSEWQPATEARDYFGRYHDGEAKFARQTGTVAHTYTDTGIVNVTATVRWTADYQLGGVSGTFTDLQTSTTLPGFRIREIQAVGVYGGR